MVDGAQGRAPPKIVFPDCRELIQRAGAGFLQAARSALALVGSLDPEFIGIVPSSSCPELPISEASGLIKIEWSNLIFAVTVRKGFQNPTENFSCFCLAPGRTIISWRSLNIAWTKPNDRLAPNAGPS
jgi:hypothetical protein